MQYITKYILIYLVSCGVISTFDDLNMQYVFGILIALAIIACIDIVKLLANHSQSE